MRLRFWVGLTAVLLIAAGSVAAAIAVRGNDVDNFHRVQDEEAIRAAHQVESVAGLSVGQLASAVSFYRATGRLSAHEFDLIATPLLNGGALNGTAFIQRVTRSQRAAFEAEHGFPIIEKGLGGPRRAGSRAVYYPVVDASAIEENGNVPLGYDIGSDPLRAPYLLRAGETGMATATRVLPLLTGGMGINVYRPVYRDRAPTATAAQRRAALIGFAAGAFRVSDLAAVAVAAVPSTVSVQLREGRETVAGATAALEDPASAKVHVADGGWLLVIRDPNRPDISLPLLIAVFGVALAALLGALVVIWSRNERMQELQRLADHDSLTGLKNRRRFEEDLRTELARSQREGREGALLLLDLDDFKEINDSLGHSAGDRAIEEVAGVLRSRLRETDVLARIGGDEFAVVLPSSDSARAHAVAEMILAALREHRPADGVPPLTASIGVSTFGAGAKTSLEEVQAAADRAMYAAKAAGRDTVQAFDPDAAGEQAPKAPEASA